MLSLIPLISSLYSALSITNFQIQTHKKSITIPKSAKEKKKSIPCMGVTDNVLREKEKKKKERGRKKDGRRAL